MALAMCCVTDKNMPVMLAVLLPQKMAKMGSFSQNVIIPKNVLARSIKAYVSDPTAREAYWIERLCNESLCLNIRPPKKIIVYHPRPHCNFDPHENFFLFFKIEFCGLFLAGSVRKIV